MKKKKVMTITITTVSVLLIILASLYMYYAYVPSPKIPQLSSSSLERVIEAGGKQRGFISYVPKHISPQPALLIVLHGTGIDGKKIQEWTGYEFNQFADRDGFIVVYPDGYDKDWNDCRKGEFSKTKQEKVDDVDFITKLIKQYQKEFGIDPKKVYLFGYSSGGMMAYRIGIQLPGTIAGIASVCAALPTRETIIRDVNSPMPPVMMVNGTGDSICPFEGGFLKLFGRKLGTVISAQESAAKFAGSRSCNEGPLTTHLQHLDPKDPTSVDRYDWLTEGKCQVRLFAVKGGGHVVPQPTARFPRLLGQMTGDLDAPAEAISFFGLNH
jgi:polyhydroxybutyrate depolymerase